MYTCPHCGEPGITWWQKATLGPAGARICKRCGQRVSVPWGQNFLIMIPTIALVMSAAFFLGGWIRIAVLVAGAVVATSIHGKWMPLRKK